MSETLDFDPVYKCVILKRKLTVEELKLWASTGRLPWDDETKQSKG